jgi:hypothetical protein
MCGKRRENIPIIERKVVGDTGFEPVTSTIWAQFAFDFISKEDFMVMKER